MLRRSQGSLRPGLSGEMTVSKRKVVAHGSKFAQCLRLQTFVVLEVKNEEVSGEETGLRRVGGRAD